MTPRPPEKRPQDCWDWITPDDVVRHALAAFYAECREVQPTGQPFLVDGQPWATRGSLFEALVHSLRARLGAQAHWAGVPDCAPYARDLQALNATARLSTESTGRRPGDPPGPPRPQRMGGSGVRAGGPVDSVGNAHAPQAARGGL